MLSKASRSGFDHTKVKPTLQNPAQIYVENWLIQGMTVIQKHLLEVLHPLLPALSQHQDTLLYLA